MDQKQTGSQPAFYHNKSKHTKSPERFSAIKTPTPSPASISGSCAPSLSPSNPPFLSATLSPPSLPPSLVTAPPDAFPPFRSFPFSLCSPLSFCHPLFTPYSLALALSLLLLHEHLPLPPTHTHSQFLFLFLKKKPTSYSCVSTSLPPTLLTLSLSLLSEGLSWKRLPPTHSLFSFQLDIRFTFTMNKRSISHVA